MNWKHLFWIVPLCLIIGGFCSITLVSELLDWTAWELTAQTASKLEDAQLAWVEKPLSNDRIMISGEFCYVVDNIPVCPKRNLTDLGFD